MQKLLTTLVIFQILLFIPSCIPKAGLKKITKPDAGEITVSAVNDSIKCDKCLQFTTRSKLTAEPQGGIIKIDEPIGDWLGTVVMYSGGLGNSYISGSNLGAKFISEIRKAGFRVIQIKWDKGWFIGSKGKYEGFKRLAVHPATITKYIYNELTDKNKPFVLFGGSGGAAQIAYLLSFYGMDQITNSAIIFGGFWMGRLDIGCFDKDSLNYYMHYSDPAKTAIDLSFGFDAKSKGPCKLCDTTYTNLYKNSSISYGGNYHYPKTKVYLIYGGNDKVGALNQGLTYYDKLTSAKSPFVHMQVIDGAPHSILNDTTGYKVLKNLIFKQVEKKYN